MKPKETFSKIAIFFLLLIAIAMIVISFSAKILPPALTGIGFIIIATLLYKK
ncbi:hypothetical protein MHL31_15310 [Lutibacter sp. A80]|uniref:hypothetical protein n=1 Tax=Lutibacter sp. A80 TaxID=2918453 RepID=UPI001F0701A5|nr:hypothetical protein [Lutibacter sp. A80]UMB60437.1 hypothetical protein MHL31_15310 [Lutibacter sp. A80]